MTGYTHPELLVETDWLEQNLSNPKVVVLDCTTHLIPNPAITYDVVPGRKEFEAGHIKGAQFCDVSKDVSDTSHTFRFMRQSPEDFAAAIRAFGIRCVVQSSTTTFARFCSSQSVSTRKSGCAYPACSTFASRSMTSKAPSPN